MQFVYFSFVVVLSKINVLFIHGAVYYSVVILAYWLVGWAAAPASKHVLALN